jgi:hypothetical protein
MATSEDILILMAEALEALPEIVLSSGPAVADAMFDVVADAARAGQTPEGEVWDLTKEHRRALVGVERHIEKVSSARVAMLRVRQHYALHDLGRAKGGIRRGLLPIKTNAQISKAVLVAVEKRLTVRVDSVR